MAVNAQTLIAENRAVSKITRFDIHQRIQHVGLMVSFTLLVLTGLPMKFSTLGISQWWVSAWGGIEVTRTTHNFAAWMMLAVCIYHIIYLVFNVLVLRKPFPVKMIPSKSDLITLYQEILYFIGISKRKPQFDRFNWREKFDYWALFWGMPVMFLSGFILMYPVFFTNIFPGWVVPTALVAHSEEAMLALIWIMIVHIFFNHFSPGIFPMNTSIFTGKVEVERYQRDHPVEYARLTQADTQDDADISGEIEEDL